MDDTQPADTTTDTNDIVANDTVRYLVLWDIDHTLVDTGGLSFELYQRAFHAATGRSLGPITLSSGRTDLDVMHETLRASGIDPTSQVLAALASRLDEVYADAREELATRGRVLPGAVRAIERLARHEHVHQGVLTGNLQRIARVKLSVYGLDRVLDLETSAFGDRHLVRAELVADARQAAAARTGATYEQGRTVLIGDTPNDVAAASASGARIIAVASGRSSAGELHEAGAEHVLDDLTDVERLVRLVLD